jgi:hypothetical protein
MNEESLSEAVLRQMPASENSGQRTQGTKLLLYETVYLAALLLSS